jgi:hypothetical protein
MISQNISKTVVKTKGIKTKLDSFPNISATRNPKIFKKITRE